MRRVTPVLCALGACLMLVPCASADVIKHVFQLNYEHTDSAGAVTSGSVRLTGLWFGELVETQTPEGAVTNPLYEQKGVSGENQLFEGVSAPGGVGQIRSIEIEVERLSFLHSEGIIHRDLAARNVLISTDSGGFALEAAQVGLDLFRSDGRAAYGPGPIRWMAPESITHKAYTGGRSVEPTLTILAGSYFEATVIPAPASVGAVLGGVCLVTRRRRG